MLNNNESSTHATRTPLLGASLADMLKMTNGEAPAATSSSEVSNELFNELKPKYDSDKMREKIERNCRYNAIKPHLLDASTSIPEPIPVISRYGSIIASEGNISAVVGAAKSKKTFLCTALVGAMLRPNGTAAFGITPSQSLVLWVDTEQSASHTQRVIKRIHRMANMPEDEPYDKLVTLTLREVEPKERFSILKDAIAYYKPRLVVIDGISDLMYNSNCIEESEMPSEREEQSPDENVCVRLIRENYPNSVERNVLTTKLVEEHDVNRAYARVKIGRALAKGLLMERGGVLYLP